MTQINLINYIKEQRHIFGICPCCSNVFRLSDTRISYKAKYAPDWLDAVDLNAEKIAQAQERFDEKKKEIKEKVIEATRRKELPKLLNRAVPFFAKQGINPQDIKTILQPIDFIAFNGMNGGAVKEVLLLDSPARTPEHQKVQHSIAEAIKNKALLWQTVKITADGAVEVAD